MKLALVYTGSFRGAGVERIVWESARHLAERHDVTVIADYWEDCGRDDVAYVRASPLPRPRELFPLTFRIRARRALDRLEVDRIVSYGVNSPGDDVLLVNSVHRAWMARKVRLASGRARFIALVSWLRPRNLVLMALERYQFKGGRYRRIVAVAEGVVDDLERLYGVDPTLATVLPNGFAPEEFSPERRRSLRDEVRKELGYADEDVVLLVVAHELERKGVPVLVDAVEAIGDERLRVLLVGRAAPTAALQRPWLRHLPPTSDVGRVHAAGDLFVLPTQYEASNLAIREALASGLPVITTDVPGAREPIRPKENGLLQRDPLDAGELAQLLRQALDAEERRRWTEAAAPSVAHLAWPNLLERLEREVLGVTAVGAVAGGPPRPASSE